MAQPGAVGTGIGFRYGAEESNPDPKFVQGLALALGLMEDGGQGKINAAPPLEWPQRAGGVGKIDFLFRPKGQGQKPGEGR